jgi:AAA15 family ATPase/GTPase
MGEFIRYNKFEDIFYDKITSEEILVETNIGVVSIKKLSPFDNFCFVMLPSITEYRKIKIDGDSVNRLKNEYINKWEKFDGDSHQAPYYINPFLSQDGRITDPGNYIRWFSPVKNYSFKKEERYNTDRRSNFLMPPYGQNLYTIIDSSKHKRNGVLKEIAEFFKEYKLQFAIRQSDTTFEVQKKIRSVVYPFAYELIADTLQRMIFNIAAIESNKESILLFEEPEAHSFPLYAQKFANKVRESTTNQFFITTHSPFILNTIVEKTPIDEVAVFIATYEKFQTKFTEVTHKQIREMLDYGNDIFFSPQVLG